MDPSSRTDEAHFTVHGIFRKEMTVKVGELPARTFKVYNVVEAFFTSKDKMVDFKASDGRIYHLDRNEVADYLGESSEGIETLRIDKLVEQAKKDDPIIREIKDFERALKTEKGHSFMTSSMIKIHLYDREYTPGYSAKVYSEALQRGTYILAHHTEKIQLGGVWVLKADYIYFVDNIRNKLKKRLGEDYVNLLRIQGENVLSAYEQPSRLIKDVESVLNKKAEYDAKLEEEKRNRQMEEMSKNSARLEDNGAYKAIKDGVVDPKLRGDKSYRDWDLREGDPNYRLTPQEAEEKRERELKNREHRQQQPSETTTPPNPDVQNPPKRHAEGNSVPQTPRLPPTDKPRRH